LTRHPGLHHLGIRQFSGAFYQQMTGYTTACWAYIQNLKYTDVQNRAEIQNRVR